ncbi:MAG TPA: hypothetical protein VLD62_10035 [Acidimicrobiia bacterium]|nr:hypothetical protein [Acidimicrobiia bacterium]
MDILQVIAVTLTIVLAITGMQIAAEFLAEEQALRELDGLEERAKA